VLDLLTGLVQKSLVVYEEDEQGRGRYRLLEPMRQYARDRLSEAGEGDTVRGRHLAGFLALAEEAEPELWRNAAWSERLETEHDNLRAALDWCGSSSPETGLRLAGALEWFWRIRGHFSEAHQRLETALAGSPSAGAAARAKALCAAAHMAVMQEDNQQGTALAEESLTLCRQAEDKSGTARSLLNLSQLAYAQGDLTRAAALAEESLVLFLELGDRRDIAFALLAVGCWAGGQGHRERGIALLEESLALSRAAGYRWMSGLILENLATCLGPTERARALFEESLAIQREFGDRVVGSYVLWRLSRVVHSMGDEHRAIALLEEGLAVFREYGRVVRWPLPALLDLAVAVQARGDHRWAQALFEEVLALAREVSNEGTIARALLGLARAAGAQGDHPTARALLEEAHPFSRGTDACMERGHLLLEMGDYAAARSSYEEGLALRRAGENTGMIGWALLEVGHAAWLQGEPAVTQSHAVEAVGLFRKIEDKDGLLAALESLVVAALAQGRKEYAARLMGAAEARRQPVALLGADWWRRPRERIGEAVHAALSEQEFAVAWSEGAAMSLEAAIELALEAVADG
jgi:tetratricopeptide (TPR) repeat protein